MQTRRSNEMAAKEATGWWAVYTRHQHEKVVADMLCMKGVEVFLPLYESMRRWKDRRMLLSLPLFPGYLFVRGAHNRRLPVVSTPGVHMILSHGEREAIIPENEIEAIRRSIEGPYRVEPHPFLKCGERVRVIRGSLSGVEGILLRRKAQYRLILSVEMLAQSVAVEVDALDVEPIAEAAASGSPIPQVAGGTTFSESAPAVSSRWAGESAENNSVVVAG
jgi:transcription antitermination factor NusG